MALTYYARADYLYNGGDKNFSIPFSYIDESHIVAVINGDTLNPLTNLTFLSANQVQINSVNTGDNVSIRRITPLNEREVIFNDGNILNQEALNLSAEQVFDAVQEVTDSQNTLVNNMQEFVNLKEYINNAAEGLSDAVETLNEAQQLLNTSVIYVNEMHNTLETLEAEMAEGVKINVTHNLFTIMQTDKELSENEALGWAEQGTDVLHTNYPDAYTEILNEYDTGVNKIYTSDSVVTTYKSYTGSISGNFYTASNVTLAAGVNVYSDTALSTVKGAVSALGSQEVFRYAGSLTSAFYAASTVNIAAGVTVYSDNKLSQALGVIEDKKYVSANKYKGSVSNVFYTDSAEGVNVGAKVYTDAALYNRMGTITEKRTVNSDKYSISGLSGASYFYVPAGTNLAVNTSVYADASCTQSLGVITSMTAASYETLYKLELNAVPSGFQQRNNQKYGYSVTAVSNDEKHYYIDENCTQYYFSTRNGSGSGNTVSIFLKQYYGVGNAQPTTTGTWVNLNYGIYGVQTQVKTPHPAYITIGSSGNCTYYKAGTVNGEVIAITGGAYQTYQLQDIIEETYIKLNNKSAYETYQKTGTVEHNTVRIGSGAEEYLTYNGIKTGAGTAFEYREAANGHKIVSSLYAAEAEAVLDADGVTDFYILNQELSAFKLPVIDENKKLYFCVGNIIINRSAMTPQTITRSYLNDRLANYTLLDDFRELKAAVDNIPQGGGGTMDYNELINKPENLSDFTDDLGFNPVHTHSQYLTQHQDISGKADKSELFSGSYNDLTDKPSIPVIPSNVSAFTNDAGYLTAHQSISGKEDASNKVTSLSSSSTDTQYPSAKCVYDLIGDIETALNTILGVNNS